MTPTPTPRTDAQIEADRIELVLSAIEGNPAEYEGFALEACQIARKFQAASRLPDRGWQPMESAPRDGTAILIYLSTIYRGSSLTMGRRSRHDVWWYSMEGKLLPDSTLAWTPLPSRPTDTHKAG